MGHANLSQLPNLEELGLGYCEKVTLANLTPIARIPKLRSRDLNSDNLTDEWIPELKEMSQPKTANLSNTQVTQHSVDEMQKTLPELKVIH